MCNVYNSSCNSARSSCGYSGWNWLSSLFNGGCSNNVATTSTSSSSNSCGCNNQCSGCGYQTVCRDCNGCLHIQNKTCGCNCGCQSCQCCNNSNSCNNCCNNCCDNNGGTTENGGTSGNNGNGNFACVTYCGLGGNAEASTTTANTTVWNADAYYARQYGLYPYARSGNYGCGCSSYSGYNT